MIFGICPHCKQEPARWLNVGRSHYFVCDDCETYWFVGCNLFSNWRRENEQIWQDNSNLLDVYQKVEPILEGPF